MKALYQDHSRTTTTAEAVEQGSDDRAAVLRHDMLNCLMALRLRLEVMRRRHILDQNEIAPLAESLERMELLVQDWRRMAQADSIRDSAALFDLAAGMRQLVEANQPQAMLRQQTLQLHIECEPAILTGSQSAIQRAVDNLISNAVKYTPAGGSITVTLTTGGGAAIIRVQDTGIGIPADEQEHIFDSRYRASNALQERIPGTGLGLAQVKQAVEQHGGTICLQSAEGCGTCIEIGLPFPAAMGSAHPAWQ